MLYALDRATFTNIVKEASMKRRERFETFLSKVELLADLDSYERGKICDVLETEYFENGKDIIKQGEKGDKFFLIEEGEAVAFKTDSSRLIINSGGKKQQVYEYKANDYFGELALLNDENRAATVVAKGKVKLNSVDRDSFKRLLGPLEDVLARNVSKYEKYVKKN